MTPKPVDTGGVEGGVALIAAERQRQIEAEGYDSAHDDAHDNGEIAQAATAYTHKAIEQVETGGRTLQSFVYWPWPDGFKASDTPIPNLVKAGALIAAEIDRLTRTTEKPTDSMGGEKDKENGAADASRSVTGEVENPVSTAADGPCPTCHGGKFFGRLLLRTDVPEDEDAPLGPAWIRLDGQRLDGLANLAHDVVWLEIHRVPLGQDDPECVHIGEQQTEPAANSVTPQGAQD